MQLPIAQALESRRLLDPEVPVLVAWSDNGPEITAGDTRTFMALMAIVQHHGRPHTPTDQAHIESLFSRLECE